MEKKIDGRCQRRTLLRLGLVPQQAAVVADMNTPWHKNTGKHIDSGCVMVFLIVIWEIIDVKQ